MQPEMTPVLDGDPRTKAFRVDVQDLSDEAVSGLIDEYCFRAWGLNDVESPARNRSRVKKALDTGELVVWFDPVEGGAALDVPVIGGKL